MSKEEKVSAGQEYAKKVVRVEKRLPHIVLMVHGPGGPDVPPFEVCFDTPGGRLGLEDQAKKLRPLIIAAFNAGRNHERQLQQDAATQNR